MHVEFEAELWLYPGEAGWHFVTLPVELAEDVADLSAPTRKGFGSVPVTVTIGASTWNTSLFPDSKAGSYLLPVKKPVRRRENLTDGDRVSVELLVRV